MKFSFPKFVERVTIADIRDASLLSLSHEKSSKTPYFTLFRSIAVILACTSGLLLLILFGTSIEPTPEFFTISLHSITIISFVAASLSLIKYYTRKKYKYLFVGVGFASVSIVNAIHAYTTLQLTHEMSLSAEYLYLSYDQAWIFSQILIATFITGGLFMGRFDQDRDEQFVKKSFIGLRPDIAALGFLLLINTLALISIPFFKIPGLGIATLLLLFISFLGYLRKGLWRFKYFEFWFTLSLVVNVWAELFFLLSSYDALYLFAFLLRLISFSLVLGGLIMSVYNAFLEVEEVKENIDIILRSIGETVVVLNIHGEIILMNATGEKMTESSIQESFGKYYSDVFHIYYENNPDKIYPDVIDRVIKHVKPLVFDRVVLKQSNDQTIPITIIASVIESSTGEHVGIVMSIRDITRERELEKTKDNFLSVAAHQLRTPLGAMRWNMEMLLSDDVTPLTPELKTTISQIYTNNQRMIGLVNDLLDVSRIDQNRVKDHPEQINLKTFIQEVFEELKAQAFKKDISLNLEFGVDDTTTINVDKNRLHDVFDNLLSNSIKYNRHGGSVTVQIADHRPYVQINIIDNGFGIPKDEQRQIFSKFFRASNARTGVADGSGLGLFVVKSYLEAWGGKISFTSTEGTGSTFTVLLPYRPKNHVLDKSLADNPHQNDEL